LVEVPVGQGSSQAAGDDTAPELVTLTEIARRVVALGYARSMSAPRVAALARTDPAWPVPKAQWRSVGGYWQIPWPPVRDYFAARDTRSGPKGWPRPATGDSSGRDQPAERADR
jgi:hypothetical protein